MDAALDALRARVSDTWAGGHEMWPSILSEAQRSADAAAAIELLCSLSDVSEDGMCSTWDSWPVSDVRRALAAPCDVPHALGLTLREEVEEIARLAAACGGWWSEDQGRPLDERFVFVPGGHMEAA